MNLLEIARGIAHQILSSHSEITDETISSVIKKVKAINIIEGENFDEQELFEILL